MDMILRCIEYFSRASGLFISPAKSKLFVSPNTNHQISSLLSASSVIPLTDSLGISFWSPVIYGRVTKETYAHLVDKILRRLADCKVKVLSTAGRRTLKK